MAFDKQNFDGGTALGAGVVLDSRPHTIQRVEMLAGNTLKAGYACTPNGGEVGNYDGNNSFGVMVRGTTNLGKTCIDEVNPEVCLDGCVYICLAVGATQPTLGNRVGINADGTFNATGDYALGKFLGIAGEPTVDGNPTALARIY